MRIASASRPRFITIPKTSTGCCRQWRDAERSSDRCPHAVLLFTILWPTIAVDRSRNDDCSCPVPVANESGLTIDPAISTDGHWLVFASDRGDANSLHLWMRPLAGGPPRQLTAGSHDDHEPAFSPDGRSIAYRSEANEGGIYLVSAEGGPPRLLAQGGRRPRFSPDGKRIVYPQFYLSGSSSRNGLFLIDVAGGQARPIHSDFYSAKDAAWSPDGKHLVFSGCKDSSTVNCDWQLSPVEGGEPIATGAAKLFEKHHLGGQPSPDLWLSNGKAILFTGKTGEKTRLWVVNVDPDTLRVDGEPRRLTSGDNDERSPSAAPDGLIVFASRKENIDIWSLPLDPDHAAPKGALVRLTSDPSIDQRPSLSLDGKKLAWETSRGGNFEVWVKDLVSGQERAITSGPLREHMPALSRDGSKLVYDAHDGDKVTILESGFAGGEPVKIWEENVGQGSFQWTAKGDSVLYFDRQPPGTVGLMNLLSKKRTALLRHPKFNLSLADARLSPDGGFIAFPVPFAPHRSRLAVARVSNKVIEAEQDWTYPHSRELERVAA